MVGKGATRNRPAFMTAIVTANSESLMPLQGDEVAAVGNVLITILALC